MQLPSFTDSLFRNYEIWLKTIIVMNSSTPIPIIISIPLSFGFLSWNFARKQNAVIIEVMK